MEQEKKDKGSVDLLPDTMKTTCPVEKKSRKITYLVILGFIIWIGIIISAVYFSTR